MPLMQKLASASEAYKQEISTCKLVALTKDPRVPKKDQEAIKSVIDLKPNDDGFIPNSHLAALLRAEGYDVSASAVDRHRGNKCSCRRLVK
jgi:hypothetical protein